MLHPDRTATPEQRALEQEALHWLSRITSGDATDADRDAFLRWRSQSPAHEQAFRTASALWKKVGQAVAVASARSPSAGRTSRRQFLKAGAMAAGVAGVAVAGAELGFWPGVGAMLADYSTATGEQRRVALSDTVQIELNTRSALSFGGGQGTTVTLTSGEAAFTVKAGGPRFQVAADNGVIAADRAVFTVRHVGNDVRITCLDGSIDVVAPARLQLASREQVVCSGGKLGAVASVDVDVATGWRNGMLVFRNEPLDSVVAELNRYRKGLVVVASRAVAERRVTGIFHLDRLDEALSHMSDTLHVPVRQFSPYLTVVG